MKRFFSTMLVIMLLVVFLAPAGAMAATRYATVVGGWLRLRSTASFSGSTINSYYTGTQVEILSVNSNWYNVRTPDGNTGYMYGDYLSIGGQTPSTPSTPSGNTNAVVVSSNGLSVRMRSGPSTSYRVVARYSVGTRVSILNSGSSWCRISVNGTSGYMMSQFLNKDGYVPPIYDGDAAVWSANGLGVRLRSGPGTGYSKIGVYSVGTQVKILSKGAVWDYIQIGSRTGYMMNQFLTYNNNYAVTEVRLNNYNPVVGNILSVQSIVPSSATVTYSWRLDGIEASTAPTYTVGAGDIGKNIQLKVTGVGSYRGEAYSTSTAAVVNYGTVTAVTINNMNPQVGNVLAVDTITPNGATVSYEWKRASDNKVLGTGATYTVTNDDYTNGSQLYLSVKGIGTYNGSATSGVTAAVGKGTSPIITTTSANLPIATKGLSYSTKLLATGGGGGFTWSITNGTLPAGLSMDSAGRITGTVASNATTQAVTFKVSNGIAPDATASLTFTVQGQTAQPTFSPNGGTFTTAQTVTLSADAGATIRYTVDGTEPSSTNGATYTSPLSINTTTTVKAYAYKSNETASSVASRVFTINSSAQTVAAPAFSVAAGAVASGTTVALTSTTSGAEIYFTTNGDTPSKSSSTSTKYTVPIAITSVTQIKAIAVKDGMTDSAVSSAAYTITTPAVQLSVGSVSFGTVMPNTTVAAQTLTITNTGSANATIASVGFAKSLFKIGTTGTTTVQTGTPNTSWTIVPDTATGKVDLTKAGSYTDTVQVTYDGGAVATAQVTLNITAKTNIITIKPITDAEVTVGTAVTLTADATGVATPVYEWYQCQSDGTLIQPSRGIGNPMTLPASTAVGTYYFRCNVSVADGSADDALSNVVTVTIKPAASIMLDFSGNITFTTQPEGYSTLETKDIVIVNSGTDEGTITSIKCSDDSTFALTSGASNKVAAGKTNDTWKIATRKDLTKGDHTAKLTLTYNDLTGTTQTKSIDVSFTVTDASSASLTLTAPNGGTIGGDGTSTSTGEDTNSGDSTVTGGDSTVSGGETTSENTVVSGEDNTQTQTKPNLTVTAPGFGTVTAGTQPAAQAITITNSGDKAATLATAPQAMTYVVSSNPEFVIANINPDNVSSTIAANGGSDTSWIIQPSTALAAKAGSHSTTISVYYDSDMPATVDVTLVVTEPANSNSSQNTQNTQSNTSGTSAEQQGTPSLAVTAPTFDAATVNGGQPSAKAITVQNNGTAAANVTGVTSSESGFTITGGAATIAAGSKDSATWTIQPGASLMTAAGSYKTTVSVHYDNGAAATAGVTFVVNAAAAAPAANVSEGETLAGNSGEDETLAGNDAESEIPVQ